MLGGGRQREGWVGAGHLSSGQLLEPELIGRLFLPENPAPHQEHSWISATVDSMEDTPTQLPGVALDIHREKMKNQVGELSP